MQSQCRRVVSTTTTTARRKHHHRQDAFPCNGDQGEQQQQHEEEDRCDIESQREPSRNELGSEQQQQTEQSAMNLDPSSSSSTTTTQTTTTTTMVECPVCLEKYVIVQQKSPCHATSTTSTARDDDDDNQNDDNKDDILVNQTCGHKLCLGCYLQLVPDIPNNNNNHNKKCPICRGPMNLLWNLSQNKQQQQQTQVHYDNIGNDATITTTQNSSIQPSHPISLTWYVSTYVAILLSLLLYIPQPIIENMPISVPCDLIGVGFVLPVLKCAINDIVTGIYTGRKITAAGILLMIIIVGAAFTGHFYSLLETLVTWIIKWYSMFAIIFTIGFGFVLYHRVISILRKIWLEKLTNDQRSFLEIGFLLLLLFHKPTRLIVISFGLRSLYVTMIVMCLQKQHRLGTDIQEILRRTDDESNNNDE